MCEYNSRTADKFVLRMPEGMRDKIKQLAKNNHRSMNNQILTTLSKELDGEETHSHTESSTANDTWIPQVGQLVWVNHLDEEMGIIRDFVFGDGTVTSVVQTKHTTRTLPIQHLKPVII